MTEQHFALTKAPLGRRRGGVVVGDGLVRFEHPLLKQPVTIPTWQIAAVVRPSDPSPVPVLVRDVRELGLGRAIVRMPIMTYDAPLSEAELRPIVAVAVAKLTSELDVGAPARET